MTDKMKVYKKVLKMLKKVMPTEKQNHVVVLAMMVTGIVLGQKAQLSEMSLHIPHSAKPDSIAKRFRRLVKNEQVDVSSLYLPFAQQIITHLADKPLYLAMDGSQVCRGCMVLMVAVIYKQRAIPLVWLVYKGKKGHTTGQRHIEALELVKPLLPEKAQVILLGDAEYDTVEMLQWVKAETNWTVVVRTEPRILITVNGKQYPIRQLLAGEYGYASAKNVLFTKQMFGPVSVVAWWEKPYKKPIYLVSNHPTPDEMRHFYSKRFKLETLFSDQKSRGFHINKSHLADPDRVARLLLATCLAYTWIVYLGVEVQHDEQRRTLVDRPNRSDKSLFRLGFDWFKYALTQGVDFKVLFFPPIIPLDLGVR